MIYDIVPLGQGYRGMGRSLTTDHLAPQKKKLSNELLELYFAYLDVWLEKCSPSSFACMLELFRSFCEHGIPCELIVYDSVPMENAYGYPIELLGIDIAHDLCESLISGHLNPEIAHLLNENGLCRTVEAVEKIIPLQDYGNVTWAPCYVYSVTIEMGQGTLPAR